MPLKRPFSVPLHELVIPNDQPNHAPVTQLWAVKPPSAPKAGGSRAAAPFFDAVRQQPVGAASPPVAKPTYEPIQTLMPLAPLAPPAPPASPHDNCSALQPQELHMPQQFPLPQPTAAAMPRGRSASHLQQVRILRAAVSASTPTLSPLSLRSSVAHSPRMIAKGPRVPPAQAGGARAYAAYLAKVRQSLPPSMPEVVQPPAPPSGLGAPPVRMLHISGMGSKLPRGRSAPVTLATAHTGAARAVRPARPAHYPARLLLPHQARGGKCKPPLPARPMSHQLAMCIR